MIPLTYFDGPQGERVAAVLLFVAVAVAFFLISPHGGDFHWSESPRNALDGAFVLDLVKDHPFQDPKTWAFNYYLQYPSLTILFYPPLLHAELAAAFAVFGVSHATASGLVALHAGLLAAGLFRLSRRLASPSWSLVIALVTVFSPEMLLWGRQILLEMPMVSYLVWSGYFWLVFLEQGKGRQLALATVLFLLAVYTKQTAVFAAPAYLVTLVLARGRATLTDRALWITGLTLIAALLPLVAMQVMFAQFNLQSVAEQRAFDLDRWSVAGLTFYATTTLAGVSPAVGVLAGIGLLSSLRTAWWGSLRRLRLGHQFLLLWCLSAYIILTLIASKSTRYGLLFYPPFLASGLAGIAMMLAHRPRLSAALQLLLGALVTYQALVLPPPHVDGYREAARYAVGQLSNGRRIAFSGNRDGAFVFNVRELDTARKLTVVRIDKLLLKINIFSELGVGEIATGISPDAVAEKLAAVGIEILVVEPSFLTGVPSMDAFYQAIGSPAFELLVRVPVSASPGVHEKELLIYRIKLPLPAQNGLLQYEVPTAHLKLKQEGKTDAAAHP